LRPPQLDWTSYSLFLSVCHPSFLGPPFFSLSHICFLPTRCFSFPSLPFCFQTRRPPLRCVVRYSSSLFSLSSPPFLRKPIPPFRTRKNLLPLPDLQFSPHPPSFPPLGESGPPPLRRASPLFQKHFQVLEAFSSKEEIFWFFYLEPLASQC